MKLFGDFPPPAWFASECLVLASNPDSVERKAFSLFILNQAAKFNLMTEELTEDLASLGISKSLYIDIIAEYADKKDEIRNGLIKNIPAIHSRVIDSDFRGNTLFLNLADHEGTVEIKLKEQTPILIESLEKAIQSFNGIVRTENDKD